MGMVIGNNKMLIRFRIALSAVNMELTDYDSRTALHVASAEGNKAFFRRAKKHYHYLSKVLQGCINARMH